MSSRDGTPMSSPFVDQPSRQSPVESPSKTQQLVTRDKLQERINALEYQLSSEKSERERDKLWYEKSLREYQEKIKDEGKRADDLESNQEFLFNKHKQKNEELDTIKDNFRQERADLESQLREATKRAEDTKDEFENFKNESRASISMHERTIEELEGENKTIQDSFKQLEEEMERTVQSVETKQNTIFELENEVSSLKSAAWNSKSSSDERESVEVVQRELSEQIQYSHQLEDKVASLNDQMGKLKESDDMLQIVQEEKSTLELKVEQMEELRQRAVDSEMQVVQLKQEKQRWTSYLNKDDNFNSPEDVVRALMRERVEKISLLDRLGKCEAELSAKDVTVVEGVGLKDEVEEWKQKYEKEAGFRARLQRQRDLTSKECTFLRDQLKSYEAEEVSTGAGQSAADNKRVEELESLLDETRKDCEKLSKELAAKEGLVVDLSSPKRRPRQSDVHDERLSESLRKVRNLQQELHEAQSQTKSYEQEISVLQSQLNAQQDVAQSKHRILELRDNPTAKYEKIKHKQLEVLKAENEDLIKKLNSQQSKNTKMVPNSVVDRVRNDMETLERQLAEQKKSKERLSKVYQKMSHDLRQTVYALVGFQVDPQPNKKVKVKSVFATNEDEVLTFVPDPTSKVPKFVGIDNSPSLTQEYSNLVDFWVKERKDIPCFLAALNLELYDKTTKAAQF